MSKPIQTAMKHIALAGVACAALAASAFAQDADEERKRELADQVMVALGYDVMAENMPSTFADATVRSMLACTPQAPEADANRLRSVMESELTRAVDVYRERIRDSYVRRLSLDELEALVAFYQTPEGQRIADAAPSLVYDQFLAQNEIDRAGLRAYEKMGWCDNGL